MAKNKSGLQQRDVLKAIRDRGWNQKRAATFLGISQESLSQLVNFHYVPLVFSDQVALRLEELTGKKVDELFPESIRGGAETRKRRLMDVEFPDSVWLFAELSEEELEIALQTPPIQEEQTRQQEFRRLLQEALGTLTDREREVIKLHFGFADNGEEVTLEELGEKFGVNRERIRQIEAKALAKLRHASRSRKLRVALGLPVN